MTMWQMYWLVMLDGIGFITCFFAISSFIFGVLAIVFSFIMQSENRDWEKDDAKPYRRFRKIVLQIGLPIFLICGSIALFLPGTKQMAAIIIVPKVVNNQKMQELPDKVLTLADKWIDELSPKTK